MNNYVMDLAVLKLPKITQASRTDGKVSDFESWGRLIQDQSIGRRASLLVTFNSTHSGTIVNNRVYPGMEMEKSVSSWVYPYGRPVLSTHPSMGSMMGIGPEPVTYGRTKKAEYVRLEQNSDAFANDWRNPVLRGLGSGFIRLQTLITDEEAIDGILSGRLQTVSTGQNINVLTCSLCGKNKLSQNACDHEMGRVYTSQGKGFTSDSEQSEYFCYGITGPLMYDHIAFVKTPANPFAGVIGIDKIEQKQDHQEGSREEFDVTDIRLHDEHGDVLFTLSPSKSISTTKQADMSVSMVPGQQRVAAAITSIGSQPSILVGPTTVKRPGLNEGTVTVVATADQNTNSPSTKENKMPPVTPAIMAESVILKSISDASLEFDWEAYKTDTGREKLFTDAYTGQLPENMVKFDAKDFMGPKNSFPVVDAVTARAALKLLPYLRTKDKSVIDSKIQDFLNPPVKDKDCGCEKNVADTDEVAELKLALDAAQKDLAKTKEEVIALRSQVRVGLVDRIVDAKIALGKTDSKGVPKEAMEKMRAALLGRTIDSLKDTLSDLQAEQELVVASRATKPVVEDPTVKNTGTKVQTADASTAEKTAPVGETKSSDLSDVFLRG